MEFRSSSRHLDWLTELCEFDVQPDNMTLFQAMWCKYSILSLKVHLHLTHNLEIFLVMGYFADSWKGNLQVSPCYRSNMDP